MSTWKSRAGATRLLEKLRMSKASPSKPRIENVSPVAAIAGGEIDLRGQGFSANGRTRPVVRFGAVADSLMARSPNRLVVRVPEAAASGQLTVEAGGAVSAPVT